MAAVAGLTVFQMPAQQQAVIVIWHSLETSFMIKYFISIMFLLSCHSKMDRSIDAPLNNDTSEILNSNAKIKLRDKTINLFDNQKEFEIRSIKNSIELSSTDTDTSKCLSWTLSKEDIKNIIINAEPISGIEWDFDFLVLKCLKSVSVFQDGQVFDIKINAGSFFWVNNSDTSVLFGNYEKKDHKYFIESPAEK